MRRSSIVQTPIIKKSLKSLKKNYEEEMYAFLMKIFIADYQLFGKIVEIFISKNLDITKSSRNFALAFGNEGA